MDKQWVHQVLHFQYRQETPDQVQFTVGRPGLEPGTDGLRRRLLRRDQMRIDTSVDLDLSRSDQVLLA